MTLRKITQMYIAIYVLAYTKLWIIYGKCNVKFQKLNIQTNTNVGISMSKKSSKIYKYCEQISFQYFQIL